jgi:hypothetical protein
MIKEDKLYRIVYTFKDKDGKLHSKHYRNMKLVVLDKVNGIVSFEGSKEENEM